MREIINIDRVPRDRRPAVAGLLNSLIDIHGDNITAAAMYGSAVGADYRPRISDINLVIVFKKLGFEDLKRSLKAVSKGISGKISAPLFITEEHMRTSLDVFPMEFLEIKENHILLYGEDLFTNLHIEGSHIRLFCEEQIKGKLLRIRQAYLEVGLRKKGMEALLKESLKALFPVFRNILRLKGVVPSIAREKVMDELGEECGIDSKVFMDIFRDKQDDEKIAGRDIEVYLEKYISEIEKLARAIDRL